MWYSTQLCFILGHYAVQSYNSNALTCGLVLRVTTDIDILAFYLRGGIFYQCPIIWLSVLPLTTNLYQILLINELKYIGNCDPKNRVPMHPVFIYDCKKMQVILWYGSVFTVELKHSFVFSGFLLLIYFVFALLS